MKFLTILLLITLVTPFAGFSQQEFVESQWQSYCESGFEGLYYYNTNQDDAKTDAQVSLANSFGELNRLTNSGNKENLQKALAHKAHLDALLEEFPNLKNDLLHDYGCFAKNLETLENRLAALLQSTGQKIIENGAESLHEAITNASLIFPCSERNVGYEIKQDGTVEFSIKIRDCKTAVTGKDGFRPGLILPPSSFDLIADWIVKQWNGQGKQREALPEYFQFEFHGCSDKLSIYRDISQSFNLDIPKGLEFLSVHYGPYFQEKCFLDENIENIIYKGDKADTKLALGRAWSAWLSLRHLTTEEPLFIAEVQDKIGGEYRGVTILIKSPTLLADIVEQQQEVLINEGKKLIGK
jgi:hypothetical protein